MSHMALVSRQPEAVWPGELRLWEGIPLVSVIAFILDGFQEEPALSMIANRQ